MRWTTTGQNGRSRFGVGRRSGVLVAAALVGAMVVGPTAAHEAHGHPAKLHEGTCADLGGVAFSLNGVGGEVDVDGNAVEPGEAVNPDLAYQVMRSETVLDASLDELLAAPHALMVYESDEDLTAISCGDLGGNRLGDELAVGLAEMGVPGHTGIALFEGGGETTTVRIFLGHALSPVSASGSRAADDGHGEAEEHAAGDHDHSHGEGGEGDHDEATPQADS